MLRAAIAASAAVLLSACQVLAGGPDFEIPAAVTGEVGRVVFVTPKTNAAAVVYVSLEGVEMIPPSKLKNPCEMGFYPPKDGEYHFAAVAVKDNEAAAYEFVVRVGKIPPKPPVVPDPPVKPDPKPDDPPVTPAADKELVMKFRQAVGMDGTDAKTWAAKLAAAYKKAADAVERGETDIPTVGHAYSAAFTASVGEKVPRLPALQYTRGVVGEALPKDAETAVLDKTLRAKYAAEFRRVASALGEATK